MQVVILCGGRGTRLGRESELRPKPMITIGEKPILWHIMKGYARYGHTDFVLCLGYLGEVIKSYFLEYESLHNDFTIELGRKGAIVQHGAHDEEGWRITLADTGPEANTGARVKRIRKYITDDTFCLTYGDGVGDVDLDALIRFHRSHGKLATVTAVHPPARFGELVLDAGRVATFAEKPQVGAGLINGGFFVFERGVFDYLSDDEQLALESEPMVHLARDGQLMAYEHAGFWQCADTVRELNMLRDFWDRGRAPWKTW